MSVRLDLSRLPLRFLEMHWLEFAAWRMDINAERDFKLRWPRGTAGASSIRLGQVSRLEGAETVIAIKLTNPADEAVLGAYMSALHVADAEFMAARGASS